MFKGRSSTTPTTEKEDAIMKKIISALVSLALLTGTCVTPVAAEESVPNECYSVYVYGAMGRC
ncbi:MAG: hypothetical protein IJC75_00730 [Oscillospiraceae bacterium]|nr:hypothetical protein [Oscillospiraceae bacterium]